MYSGETDFLSPLVSYFAGEIMCSSLGLAIVVISMYKINLSQVKACWNDIGVANPAARDRLYRPRISFLVCECRSGLLLMCLH